MISIDPSTLKTIEAQLAAAMFNALDQVQEGLQQAATGPHWVSHNDAIEKMGWPEIFLKKGVQFGHLNPIKFRGKGGTKYDTKELLEYKEWLMDQQRANKLSNQYITSTDNLAQKKSDNHVLPRLKSDRRPGNGLPRRRQSAS